MSHRDITLNEQSGRQISDLEALIIVMDKLLSDKLEQKPKSGITIAKGKINERKFRYTDAMDALRCLKYYFGDKGCFSCGVCETCKYFDPKGHANEFFGTCTRESKPCTKWDTCQRHSKKGGGYGI